MADVKCCTRDLHRSNTADNGVALNLKVCEGKHKKRKTPTCSGRWHALLFRALCQPSLSLFVRIGCIKMDQFFTARNLVLCNLINQSIIGWHFLNNELHLKHPSDIASKTNYL